MFSHNKFGYYYTWSNFSFDFRSEMVQKKKTPFTISLKLYERKTKIDVHKIQIFVQANTFIRMMNIIKYVCTSHV